MSIAIQKRVWKLQITAPEKLVLLCLADYARDEDQRAYPSIATIADVTCLSERQVQRHLAALVDAGHITVDDNPYGGRGKARVYRFKIGKGDADDAVSEEKRVTSMTEKDDVSDTVLPQQRVTSRAERVTSTAVKGDIHDATYIRNEPLENHQEPSKDSVRVLNTDTGRNPAVRGDSPAHRLVNRYYDIVGGVPTDHGRDIGNAKTLIKVGVTAENLPEFIGWLRNHWRSKSGFDLTTAARSVNEWASTRSAPKPIRRLVV